MKAHSPGLWMIKRESCHRFVVKKKWSTVLTVAGCDFTKAEIAGKTPVIGFVDQSMFFKKLGVKTEWKNSTGGDIRDLKTGALYIVGAPSYDFKVNCNVKFRVYFKSIDYQHPTSVQLLQHHDIQPFLSKRLYASLQFLFYSSSVDRLYPMTSM